MGSFTPCFDVRFLEHLSGTFGVPGGDTNQCSQRISFTKETLQAKRNRYKFVVIYVGLDKECFFDGARGLFLLFRDYINLIVCSQT